MFFSNLRKNIQNQQMNTREVLGESGRTLSNLDSERLNRVMTSSLGEERPTSEGLGSLPNIFQPETLMPTINSIGRMVARGRMAFEEGLDQAKQFGSQAVETFMDGYRDEMNSRTISSMELTEPSDFGEAMVERKMKDFPFGSKRKPSGRFGDPSELETQMRRMQDNKLLQRRGSGLGSLRMQ